MGPAIAAFDACFLSGSSQDRLARDFLVLKVWDKDQAKDECMGAPFAHRNCSLSQYVAPVPGYAIMDFSIENRLSGEPVPFTLQVSLGTTRTLCVWLYVFSVGVRFLVMLSAHVVPAQLVAMWAR